MMANYRDALFAGAILAVCLTVLASAQGLLPDERIIIAIWLTAAATGVAALVAYGRLAWRSARLSGRHLSAEDYLALGIFLTWAGTVGLSLWHLTWRLAVRPAWMIDSEINGLWLFMVVLGGMFLLAAPGAIDGHIPRRNQIVLGVIAGAVVFFIMLLEIVSDVYPSIAVWLEEPSWEGCVDDSAS